MKIIKFNHACFVVSQQGQSVVIDPGQLTDNFVVPNDSVIGIVITHIHSDHLDQDKIRLLQAKYPEAIVYAPLEVISQLDDEINNRQAVKPSDSVDVGTFHLEFTGGMHALIHTDIATCANLGVIINNKIYYPGDSFANPGKSIDVLALPIAAPWMKTAEGMDFLVKVSPKIAFPTHDAILSVYGQRFVDNWMKQAAEKVHCKYLRLDKSPFVIE